MGNSIILKDIAGKTILFQEYEIDKILGIKGPHDVLKLGIDKYNAECRSIVMRYASEWEVCAVSQLYSLLL